MVDPIIAFIIGISVGIFLIIFGFRYIYTNPLLRSNVDYKWLFFILTITFPIISILVGIICIILGVNSVLK
jgi:uncharacterized membrane protein HdeD (DUF308 family)